MLRIRTGGACPAASRDVIEMISSAGKDRSDYYLHMLIM
jgi:hypothetical protein